MAGRLSSMDSTPAGTYKNSLLKALGPEIVERLCLHPVTFALLREIEFPGNPIENLFFVEEGMASMTTTFKDGSQVEVGMFGYGSVIGVSALMGTKRSLNRVYTQIPGFGYSCPVEAARREFEMGGVFQKLALRYVQAQLVQAVQSAGCNAKRDTFEMSHDFLADMLGSARPTLSIAAGVLKNEGLIEYSRGVIRILDGPRLENRACECYHIIKDHLDNYAEFDSGIVA
jgi:CRP-like cAMP-binding protein